ncbi:MAG: regulatory protein RecX [Victivallaceae bacterium]|nr:regulatory protein RecX [Victivallaceae bacterium]
MPRKELSATERAMRYLAQRAHSEQELRGKLRRAGYADEAVEEAINACLRHGYINDELMAEDGVGLLAGRGLGSRLIKLKLRQRGLSAENIESAFAVSPVDEQEAARQAFDYKLRLLSRESDPRKKREKLYRFMISRGFPPEIIRGFFSEI